MQIIDAEAHVMGALIREEILPDKAWTYPYNPPRPNNLAREVRAQLMDPSQNKLFVEDLIATMDEHGVERAVVQPGASTLTNDEVVQVLAQYPDRFIGFGRWDHFDPRPGKRGSGGMLEAADAMERGIRDLGLRGIGEVALGFWYPIPTDEVHVHVRPMMEVAAAYNVPVAFHTGWHAHGFSLRYEQPILLDDIALEYPEVPIIFNHMGCSDRLFFDQALMVARRHERVFLQTSHTRTEFVEEAVNAIGADRVLFGSDFNVEYRSKARSLGIDIVGINIRTVSEARISDDAKEKIFAKNLAELRGI
jgi:predicted TIM-barrel fold metal-dependent hydrolase